MKRIFTILILLTLLGIVACNSEEKCDCSRERVCITIINSTGQPIKNVRLLTHGISKEASGLIETDDKTCFSFNSPGENSFNLTAILNNGETVISTEVYSEGGYKFIGTISNDTIKIEYNNNY
jgi:hypothetical protein